MGKAAIIIIKLGFAMVNPNAAHTVDAQSGMTVSSGANGYTVGYGHTPHSVKARNAWDTLRLTPNGEGVAPLPMDKGHL